VDKRKCFFTVLLSPGFRELGRGMWVGCGNKCTQNFDRETREIGRGRKKMVFWVVVVWAGLASF
jgi:hypothetical protein